MFLKIWAKTFARALAENLKIKDSNKSLPLKGHTVYGLVKLCGALFGSPLRPLEALIVVRRALQTIGIFMRPWSGLQGHRRPYTAHGDPGDQGRPSGALQGP